MTPFSSDRLRLNRFAMWLTVGLACALLTALSTAYLVGFRFGPGRARPAAATPRDRSKAAASIGTHAAREWFGRRSGADRPGSVPGSETASNLGGETDVVSWPGDPAAG